MEVDWETDENGDEDVPVLTETPEGAATAPESVTEKPEANEPQKRAVTPLEATLILARRGRKEILPKLRKLLAENPELWKQVGNLALQSQESWLQLISGQNLYLGEALRRHLDEMRSDLSGPKASPLERILVDRILATHVQVLYFETMEAQIPGENRRLAQYRLQRQDQAHRQFLSAVKTLATVRNLMAKTIQVELVQRVPVAQPLKPLIAEANGEQPLVPRRKTGACATIASTNRVNGCNRLRHLLDPVGTDTNG